MVDFETFIKSMNDEKTMALLKADFFDVARIRATGWLRSLVNRCQRSKRNKLVNKALIKIDKEMDLQKLIHRQRILLMTAISHLTPQ